MQCSDSARQEGVAPGTEVEWWGLSDAVCCSAYVRVFGQLQDGGWVTDVCRMLGIGVVGLGHIVC